MAILNFLLLLGLIVFIARMYIVLVDRLGILETQQIRILNQVNKAVGMLNHAPDSVSVESTPADRFTGSAQPVVRPVVPEPDTATVPIRAVGTDPGTTMQSFAPATVPIRPTPSEPVSDRQTEREPSRVAETAREIIGKIWNWILVGDEHRAAGVSAEYAIASTWLLRVGILAIVMCVAYFLKWTIERELLGPAARVPMSILTGIVLVVFGTRHVKGQYRLIGQGLLGAGLLTLYFSMYAAVSLYHLIGLSPAYCAMILITVTAGILSVKTDSLLTAIVGITGGFLTPVLMAAPDPDLPGRFFYILLLNIGILGIANYRAWRLLNYLGFLLTYGIFWVSMSRYTSADFPFSMVFLSAFFLVHAAIVLIPVKRKTHGVTPLEILHLTGNALLFSHAGYSLIHREFGRPYPAIMTLGLALFFIVTARLFFDSHRTQRAMLTTLIALAGGFTIWTLPITFDGQSLTIALSLLAMMFLWIGFRIESPFLQNLAVGVYSIVFYRLMFMDLYGVFPDIPAAGSHRMVDYLHQMAPRLWTFGTATGSFIAAYRLMMQRAKGAGGSSQTPHASFGIVPARFVHFVFLGLATVVGFVYLQYECNAMFTLFEPLRLPALTFLWCGLAVFLLNLSHRPDFPSRPFIHLSQAALILVILKLFVFDLSAWQFGDHGVYHAPYTLISVAMRFLDFGFVIGVTLLLWKTWSGSDVSQREASAFGGLSLILGFIYSTIEINTLLYWKLPQFQSGGISILWAVFAISLIAAGIGKKHGLLRWSGLVLFTVVSLKIFILDLAAMAMIYRVIAFLAVGTSLILGSFAYLRSSSQFTDDAPASDDSEIPGEVLP